MTGDGLYYFNRCRRCNSLITKLQIRAAFDRGEASVCPCGSGMFGPTNPIVKGWIFGNEWLSFAVLKMVVYQLLGWLPPAPEPSELVAAPSGVPVTPLSDAEKKWGVEDEE